MHGFKVKTMLTKCTRLSVSVMTLPYAGIIQIRYMEVVHLHWVYSQPVFQ
jgi:hypothetical protein